MVWNSQLSGASDAVQPRTTNPEQTTLASILRASNTVLTQSAYANRFLFTGREWLRRMGIYDYRNRVYSPDLGRFLQSDPIRFDAGDVNLYRYVFNQPNKFIDPSGEWVGAALGTIALGIIATVIYEVFIDPIINPTPEPPPEPDPRPEIDFSDKNAPLFPKPCP